MRCMLHRGCTGQSISERTHAPISDRAGLSPAEWAPDFSGWNTRMDIEAMEQPDTRPNRHQGGARPHSAAEIPQLRSRHLDMAIPLFNQCRCASDAANKGGIL